MLPELIFLVVLIVILLGLRTIVTYVKNLIWKPVPKVVEIPVQTQPQPPVNPIPTVQPEFKEFFINEPVFNDIGSVESFMQKERGAVEAQFMTDYENLRAQLVSVKNRKEQIRKYGLELAILFERYSARQIQLEQMMMKMDEIIKEGKQHA